MITRVQTDKENIERLTEQRDAAREALREAYEIYAGSECGRPIYASEAYTLRILQDMVAVIGAALGKEER